MVMAGVGVAIMVMAGAGVVPVTMAEVRMVFGSVSGLGAGPREAPHV
jgi:hypothetical protein